MEKSMETDGNRIDLAINANVKIFLFCAVCKMGLEVATSHLANSLEITPCSRCIYDAKQEALTEQ